MEKREHSQKMKKMEQEMEEVFEMKVVEKQQKLKDIELDVSPFMRACCARVCVLPCVYSWWGYIFN